MKTLIIEDDYITSQIMQEIMLQYGSCDIAEDGTQALAKISEALDSKEHFDVIFLDIMMPGISGQEVLTKIRYIEEIYGFQGLDACQIIMTTALDDYDNIKKAFVNQAEAYIVKPIENDKIKKVLQDLHLI